jgi:carboxyl-terminal processing protease
MPLPRRLCWTAALIAPLMFAACGGGGDGGGSPPIAASCSIADQQDGLRSYFNDNYFWYRLSPSPSPAGYAGVDAYFKALLYGGGDPIPGDAGGARWPSDRYSYSQSTASFNRFFGDGQTLGYGVMVNGLEAVALKQTRLFMRYAEPASPAAMQGLARGDEILTVNGTPAATLITSNDFSALTPNQQGDQLRLDVRRANGTNTVFTLAAAVYALTPVQNGKVVLSPNGRSMGYVFVKDMISQANTPFSNTMANFKSQGIQELVLDLRYNGGGLVSVGSNVASYAAGNRGSGQVYTRLLYNDKQSARNQDYLFSNPAAWNGFSRVYVLMGERTCSASEQVINGLRGVGVTVVPIGDTTCGKPVGFLPNDDACGTTYSVVNFEGVNALNQGRYFDGLAPTCAVAEDFSRPIGDIADPLLVAAAHHVDSGACPVAASREQPLSRPAGKRAPYRGADGGEHTGMLAR